MTTGQEIALYIFLVLLAGGGMWLRQLLRGDEDIARPPISRSLLVTAAVLTVGSVLLTLILE